MLKKSISVIVPAKNEESNIANCLSSLILNFKDRTDFEIIVVDNGSTDSTAYIAKQFGVNVIGNTSKNISGIRNYGASLATGDLLAFVDADCIVSDNWLESVNNVFSRTEVGCTGSTPVAPTDGTWVEMVWSSFRTRRATPRYCSWINSSNLIVKREYFNQVGGFDETLDTCEDVDIGMRLSSITKIYFDPRIVVVHFGEPKTIKQFFLKEVWRGKGNIKGFFRHGLKRSEISSLVLPIYYLFFNGLLLLNLILTIDYVYQFSIFLMAYLLPAIIFALYVLFYTKKLKYLAGYIVLFLIYANARALALFFR